MAKVWTPRPYQGMGMRHALDVERCAIWAGPGMGKTVTAESVLDIQFMMGESKPALVLAPMRVARKTWADEVGKWEHLSSMHVAPIVGTEDQRLDALAKLKTSYTNVFTLNYENLPWLIDVLDGQWPFGTIIADEATKLKGFRVQQGGRRAHALGRVAFRSKSFIELTGTPSPNGLTDLWGQLYFLDKGARLGRSFSAFEDRWFAWRRAKDAANPGKTFMYKYIMPFAQEQIHDAIKDLCLSINPADYFDLEEPVINNVYVDLGVKARLHYNEMSKDFFTQLDQHAIEAKTAAVRSQKLLQLANGAAYIERDVEDDTSPRAKQWRLVHDEKIEAAESIVSELGGAQCLIVYHFKSDMARLLKAFPQSRVCVSIKDEEDFKAGKIPQLLVHPDSVGHGVDGFQNVCNTIIFFGHWWNLETYQQIIERIGPVRQIQAGFKRPVFIHHILARDTIDELVMARRETKRSVQDILLEAMRRFK